MCRHNIGNLHINRQLYSYSQQHKLTLVYISAVKHKQTKRFLVSSGLGEPGRAMSEGVIPCGDFLNLTIVSVYPWDSESPILGLRGGWGARILKLFLYNYGFKKQN